MKELGIKGLSQAFTSAYYHLDNNEVLLNELNVFPVPDGDTGTNMSLTISSAIKKLKEEEYDSIYEVAKAVSDGALMGARGNSGVILSQIFRGFASALKDRDKLDIISFADGLVKASETAYNAVMKPTEGTILTVIREMSEFAVENKDKYEGLREFAEAVLQAGEISLAKTPELLPPLKEAGVVDAGGKGIVLLLEGAIHCRENEVDKDFDSLIKEFDKKAEEVQMSMGDITYAYCTEMLLVGYANIGELRTALSKEGDSHLVVGDDKYIKIHLHTNNPGKALEIVGAFGELTDIKIDNMRLQFAERQEKVNKNKKSNEETKEYGFIAVSSGEGIKNIFLELGANEVISGGQTMNPSTEDILEAIERLNAKNIFVLPNNSNILLASTQAAKLTEKNVKVIPTKSIPEGFTAMMFFDSLSDVDTNETMMNSAIEDVVTAELTYAVRDTTLHGKEIKKGNFIGVNSGDIPAYGKNIDQVIDELLDGLITDEHDLLTIIYGEETKDIDAEKVFERLSEKYNDMDVELVEGNQPIYFYIFSIE